MSDAGTIVDKIAVHVVAQVTGVTVSKQAVSIDDLSSESFPHAILLQTGYGAEPLDWQQELRTWTITGALFVNGETDTRETVQAHLEAIRDAINSDPTLTGAVDVATMEVAALDDHPDSPIHAGDFEVTAGKVV